MACTTRKLSPELHKPLHTQVTALREERVTLLEENRALREEVDRLKKERIVAERKAQQAHEHRRGG